MSFEHLSTNQPGLFGEPESASAFPAPRVTSARSANHAAWWRQSPQPHRDLPSSARPATTTRGPSSSACTTRPWPRGRTHQLPGQGHPSRGAQAGIDRNAYARILNALEAIEGGASGAAARRASRASRAPWRAC